MVRAALCGERDAPDRWLAGSVLAGLTSTNKIMKLTGFAVAEASSAAAAEAAKTSGDLIRQPSFGCERGRILEGCRMIV